MRKTITLIIAAFLLLPLFYGCGYGSIPGTADMCEYSGDSEGLLQASATDPSSAPPRPAKDSIDENATISYLGPEGTYTEEAAEFFFDFKGSFAPKKTVDEAIEDAASGVSNYAVIPQENTIGGAVTNYVDALLGRDDVYVVGEVIIPINQTLLGTCEANKIDDIGFILEVSQHIKDND